MAAYDAATPSTKTLELTSVNEFETKETSEVISRIFVRHTKISLGKFSGQPVGPQSPSGRPIPSPRRLSTLKSVPFGADARK